MAAMFSNNQPLSSSFFPNQSLASLIPPFFEEHETLISQQIRKKPRLTSWGWGDGSFNKIPPFFHEHQTLISQQNYTKKPRLEPPSPSPWWSVDKSLDELSLIFKKPPPITSNSTVGVSKPPPEVIVIDDDDELIEELEIPELIDFIIYDDELIEEEIPELSDFIFDNTPPMASPSSFVIDDDDDEEEEEEMVAISNDNNQKLDSNGKKSSSVNNNAEDSGSHGGFGRVTVYDLGVTVEDLKNIPWEEAFDPSLGIKSVTMDPSFGWICSTDF